MADLIGKTIGDYKILETLDDAGDVVVFKGTQVSSNRSVAIKAINLDEAKDKRAVQTFTQHAELAARVQHPNVLPVLDSGQIKNVGVLVTPYMENRSVADHRSSYTGPSQVLAMFKAVALGLEAINAQGSIHGNLQSKNIILDDNKQPLLTGFGIPFRQGATPSPNNSPEQVQGGVVDQRTDIYALGVILYELLAGQAPAPGTTLNLQAVRSDLPPGIDQVILKATAQNPDQRFQNAGELHAAFASALQPAQEAVPVAVPPPTSAQPQAQEKKGTNWMAIIVGGLVVLMLFLAAIVIGPLVIDALNPEAEPAQPVVEEPVVEPPPAEIEPPAAELPEPEVPPPDGQPDTPELPAPGEGGFSEICNSLGLAGGIVVGGGALARRRRRRSRE